MDNNGLNFNFQTSGIEKAQAKLSELMKDYPNEVAAALTIEAETTMTESKELVPVDTGTLKTSGFVEKPKITLKNVTIKLGYGGAATKINSETGQPTSDYAVYVHENLLAFHKVGQAKFLEDPLRRRQPDMIKKIVARVKKRLKKIKEGGGI